MIKPLLGLNINGFDTARLWNKGYHGCVGQRGTTSIPWALSFIIFLNVLSMTEEGGKA